MASLDPRNVRLLDGIDAKWSQSLSLEDFGTRLALIMDLSAFEYDAENVYEWGQTLTENGYVEVNISWRHGYVPPASESISVILMVSKDAPVEWDEQWLTKHLLPQYVRAIATITMP